MKFPKVNLGKRIEKKLVAPLMKHPMIKQAIEKELLTFDIQITSLNVVNKAKKLKAKDIKSINESIGWMRSWVQKNKNFEHKTVKKQINAFRNHIKLLEEIKQEKKMKSIDSIIENLVEWRENELK